MIFVTVGTQMAFPRLLQTVSAFAAENPGTRVEAQVGPDAAAYPGIDCTASLSIAEMDARMQAAEVVIAHAGMGTILSALSFGTPVVVMPRRAALGEHRNEHQLATAERLKGLSGLTLAADEAALRDILKARAWPQVDAALATPPAHMITQIADFIHGKA
ncbi:MAG: glycosyltransferase [Pseudomonadota bacterium]